MSKRDRGFDHERLEVYQRALELVEVADGLASRFSGYRRHLGWQLHRAVSSVPLNIAEANGRFRPHDKAQFLAIATGSALECAAIVDIADRLGVGTPEELAVIRGLLQSIVPMLIKLGRTIRSRARP